MREVIRIPMPHEGNPNYPLPPDYGSPANTDEYQRCARINAARQWLLPYDTKVETQTARVESLRFFDHYYLWPDEEAGFEPVFYDDEPRDTPDFHWQIVAQWATERLTTTIAPRGGAKSSLNYKDISHGLVTSPKMSYVYCTSTNDNAKFCGSKLKDTIYTNSRIFDDFAAETEFGGTIKPQRGELPTGVENFALTNRAWLQTTSVESRQRGKRPRRYRLDDPEYDPASSTSVTSLREGLEWTIMRVILPMIFRPGTGCDWIGTYVSKRHLLYQATSLVPGADGRMHAEDARFENWARMIVDAVYTDERGEEKSCWPDMWPMTIAEKNADPRLKHTMSIEEMPEILGRAVFLSEMRAKPGSSEKSGFPPLNKARHGYQFTKVDDVLRNAPRLSATEISWNRSSKEDPDTTDKIQMPLKQFLSQGRMFMTLDTAKTSTTSSDWKVATIMHHLGEPNELFVLDMIATKKRESIFIEEALRLADRWKCPYLYPEVVRESYSLYSSLKSISLTRATEHMGLTHVPKILPLKPGLLSKQAKIETLDLRFEHGLIKLPFWLQHKAPWSELFLQIEEFSPEVRDGGLAKDDHLDTVAMSNLIIRTRGGTLGYAGEEDLDTGPPDVLKELAAGNLEVAGVPYLQGTPLEQVPASLIGELISRYDAEQQHPDSFSEGQSYDSVI